MYLNLLTISLSNLWSDDFEQTSHDILPSSVKRRLRKSRNFLEMFLMIMPLFGFSSLLYLLATVYSYSVSTVYFLLCDLKMDICKRKTWYCVLSHEVGFDNRHFQTVYSLGCLYLARWGPTDQMVGRSKNIFGQAQESEIIINKTTEIWCGPKDMWETRETLKWEIEVETNQGRQKE